MADQAEIHRKVVSGKVKERIEAARQPLSSFADLPDRAQAWDDLHLLTQNKDLFVRRRAVCVLGSAFQHVPDREQAWEDLHRLTQDEHWYVRISANHSLGRASIFEATEAESEAPYKQVFSTALIDAGLSLQIVAIWFLEDWCMFAFGYHH